MRVKCPVSLTLAMGPEIAGNLPLYRAQKTTRGITLVFFSRRGRNGPKPQLSGHARERHGSCRSEHGTPTRSRASPILFLRKYGHQFDKSFARPHTFWASIALTRNRANGASPVFATLQNALQHCTATRMGQYNKHIPMRVGVKGLRYPATTDKCRQHDNVLESWPNVPATTPNEPKPCPRRRWCQGT